MRSSMSLNKLQSIVSIDRLSFLEGLEEAALSTGNMLDLQHQTILRIMAEIDPESLPQVADKYVSDCSSRTKFLFMAKKHLGDVATIKKSDVSYVDTSRTVGGYSYSAAKQELVNDFYASLKDIEEPDSVSFSTSLGFAFFPVNSVDYDEELDINFVTESRYASTGAMMYYGFNTHPGKGSYLQSKSIKVLSVTFASLLRNIDLFKTETDFAQKNFYRELKRYAACTPDWEHRIESDTTYFLAKHEAGHSPSHKGNAILFGVLAEYGIPADSFYQIEFPQPEDLKAWKRIRQGKGTPKDALFLLGDFLANMAIIKESAEHPSHALLRAFNWWLVKPPAPNTKPRGLNTFLAHSYEYDPNSYQNDLGLIFQTASADCQNLSGVLNDFEQRGWNGLTRICQSLDKKGWFFK